MGPRKRGRRPKTYDAVLRTTSELLETVPLAELSVAQILDAAQVGRTSFYEHFASKDDVVVKLLRSVSAEVAAGMAPVFNRGERSTEEAFREGLANWIRISAEHRSLIVAVVEEWPAVPELAALIEADRAAGLAPPGADAQALAASLVWGGERAFHIASAGRHPTLVDEQAIVEPLVQLFVGTIYGCAVSAQPGSPSPSARPPDSG